MTNGVWGNSHVNQDTARSSGSGSGDECCRTFNWTTFETGGSVTVRVKLLSGAFTTCVIRPTRFGITATKIGSNIAEFTVQPGQKVSVEFDTAIKASCFTGPPYGLPCIKDMMMVFADPLKLVSATNGIPASDFYYVAPGTNQTTETVTGATPPSAGKSTLGNCSGKKVVVFQAGVHDIGYWQVPTNINQIHFEAGAVVFGAVDVIPQGYTPYDTNTINSVWRDNWSSQKLRSSFKVTGPGVLSGSRLPWHLKKDFTYTSNDDWWAHVKLLQLAVTNITVEDVTLVSSPHWVLSFINDDDARTKGTLDNFKMVGAWTYNNDGVPNPSGSTSIIKNAFIHADDDALKIYNNDSRITNCVIWQSNNGASIQFGWFPKTVSNVTVNDIDVIHFENWYGVNQVNRAVISYANAGGSGTISNIRFNNFNIEGKVLRLFGLNTVGSAQVIRDVSFNGLSVGGMGVGQLGAPGANYFIGTITNWAFTNFVFQGTNITSLSLATHVAQFEFTNGAGVGFKFQSSAPNTLPTITSVAPQVMGANGSRVVNVTIGDAETPAGSLEFSAVSTNQNLLPDANLLLGGSSSSRTVTLYPIVGQTGQTLVTLTVDDGTDSTNKTFLVTVTNAPAGPNTPPVVSAIPAQAIAVGGGVVVPFTISDAEQAAIALVVSGVSTNQSLLPDANLLFSGSGSNRTVTAIPVAGQAGTTLLTVTASDGYTGTPRSFLLNVTNAPPAISVQPADQSASIGQNIAFSVTAAGSQPLVYQWRLSNTNLPGAIASNLLLNAVDNGDAGVYRVVITNSAGSVTSSAAMLTVNTNAGGRLYWIGGTASGIMSNTNNYRLNPDGTGGAPAAVGAGDVIDYTASGSVNQGISQSTTLSFGAFHNNTNTTGAGYIFFNGSAGTGTWTINGATVGGTTNAAFVNDQNRGFNFKADVVLNGGGEFVFQHRSGSSGEYQGNSFREANGAATVVFQGQTPTGGNALFIWGKTDGSTVWGFTGGVIVREKASADFVNGFDLSAGGALTVDPAATGARFKMSRVTTNKAAQLIVRGTNVPPGTYTKAQLNTLLGLSGDTVFEGSGGTLVVTGLPVVNPPPFLTIQRGADATVTVSWPAGSTLLQGDAPASPGWQPVTSGFTTANNTNNWTTTISNSARFFRAQTP